MRYSKISRKWIDNNFIVDADNGILVHRHGRYCGQVAGSENGEGYLIVKKSGKSHYIHRLLAQYKSYICISNYHVHHADGNRGNNKKENLVLITQAEHNGIRSHSGRQTLRYRGIIKREFAYGVRYYAVLMQAGQRFVGPKRTTQLEAWKDYVKLYAKHRGLKNAPQDVLKTYLSC